MTQITITTTTPKKEYNLTVTRMYTTARGNYRSVKIDDDTLEAIQSVRKDGMLILKVLPPEKRSKETTPHAYLEYVKPEDMAAFFAANPKKTVDTVTTDDTF